MLSGYPNHRLFSPYASCSRYQGRRGYRSIAAVAAGCSPCGSQRHLVRSSEMYFLFGGINKIKKTAFFGLKQYNETVLGTVSRNDIPVVLPENEKHF
jgi:hypothetical protein